MKNRRNVSFAILLALLGWHQSSFGCFILVMKSGTQVLVTNHEDWFAQDAAIRVHPRGANQFGSMVFTFVSEGWAQGGINEHGLFFDAAYTPYQQVDFPIEKKRFAGYIWQAMLDRCKDVAEALEFLDGYQLPDLQESHIVLADASGQAVILGVDHGRVVRKHLAANYLLQTNFNPWQPELSDEPRCWRSETAIKIISSRQHLDEKVALEVLKATHQDTLTVYSNLYDLSNKTITVYHKRHFGKPIKIAFDEFMLRGDCMIALDDLEKHGATDAQCQDGRWGHLKIKGRVLNATNATPVPYTNIGMMNRELGTLSDEDGTFELMIPLSSMDDSLRFSSIGFKSRSLHIGPRLNGEIVVRLQPVARVLNEVEIKRPRQFKVARLGWMGGRDGVLPMDTVQGGGAVAMLVEAPAAPVFIEKFQVRLMYNSKDTLKLRLHFYALDTLSGGPGHELLQKEVMLTETKKYGWLRYDLRHLGISIPHQQFFVGLEWIDERATRQQMINGLRDWEQWKKIQFEEGNNKVERIIDAKNGKILYKYHGNMMNWPGFRELPPFTGLMVETGKHKKTERHKTFERKTSFAPWRELDSTLNAVVVVVY
ncbi:MAG: carboxypeptidase-like regulatory domain-containing protein [Cyclobacteriaceae bacterium]